MAVSFLRGARRHRIAEALQQVFGEERDGIAARGAIDVEQVGAASGGSEGTCSRLQLTEVGGSLTVYRALRFGEEIGMMVARMEREAALVRRWLRLRSSGAVSRGCTS